MLELYVPAALKLVYEPVDELERYPNSTSSVEAPQTSKYTHDPLVVAPNVIDEQSVMASPIAFATA